MKELADVRCHLRDNAPDVRDQFGFRDCHQSPHPADNLIFRLFDALRLLVFPSLAHAISFSARRTRRIDHSTQANDSKPLLLGVAIGRETLRARSISGV